MASNGISDKVYRLLDAINRNGWDNTLWGLIEDQTSLFFGASWNYKEYNGKWLYLYSRSDIIDWNGIPIECDDIIANEDGDVWRLFKL